MRTEISLARISHQAASDTDETLVIHGETEMVKNTECDSRVPITVQAGLRVRKLALHSNRSYGYAFRSRAALTNTSPSVLPGDEMITPRFGSTKDFAKEWNNPVYFRLSKMLCGFKDQVRARPSGGTGGLCPAPAPVILVRIAG
jgi:hypothetical protein